MMATGEGCPRLYVSISVVVFPPVQVRRGSEQLGGHLAASQGHHCPFSIDFFIAAQDNLQDLSLKEWTVVPFLCRKS